MTRHLDFGKVLKVLDYYVGSPLCRFWIDFIDFDAILNTSLRGAKRRGNPLKIFPLPLGEGRIPNELASCKNSDEGVTHVAHLLTSNKSYSNPPLKREGTRGSRHSKRSEESQFIPLPNPLPQGAREKRVAFTLAEVLITLGIIGIVAALTISNLVTKYQKHVAVVRLKEAYTILNQAVRLSERDNGDITTWDYEGYAASSKRKEFAKKYLQPYLKLTEIDAYKLRLSHWKILDGTVDHSGSCGYCSPQFAMNNGMNIAFFPQFQTGPGNYVKIGVWIFVDINGAKGPGRMGRDVFVMSIYPYRYPNEKVVLGAHEQCGNGHIHNSGLTRDQILTHPALCAGCNKEYTGLGYACSRLIQLDGWQIKNDYPW